MLGQTGTPRGAREQPRGAGGGQGVCTVCCYCLHPRQGERASSPGEGCISLVWGQRGDGRWGWLLSVLTLAQCACLYCKLQSLPGLVPVLGCHPSPFLSTSRAQTSRSVRPLATGAGSRPWPQQEPPALFCPALGCRVGASLHAPLQLLGTITALAAAQPLRLLALISRDRFKFCSLGLRQGKPLTRGWRCTVL